VCLGGKKTIATKARRHKEITKEIIVEIVKPYRNNLL